MKLKNEIQYQKEHPKQSLASKMKQKKQVGADIKDSEYVPNVKDGSSSSQNQFAPKQQVQEPVKFEINPKHKLSRKKKDESQEEFVAKKESKEPMKGVDASELESQFIRKKDSAPKGLSAEEIEREMMGGAKISKPVNAEDLESMMAGKVAKPQPTDIDEIEAQMLKGVSK